MSAVEPHRTPAFENAVEVLANGLRRRRHTAYSDEGLAAYLLQSLTLGPDPLVVLVDPKGPSVTYRTGRTVPNTLYDGGVFIGSAITGHKAQQLVEAANLCENITTALAHHLDSGTDPCQDRGVEWPCDVAAALGVAEDGGA